MTTVALDAHFIEKYYFWPLFLTEITVKIKNHGHIRDQQVKIYKNPWFNFDFTSLEFLTVFSTAIWTGSWWRRKLKWNRKPSFKGPQMITSWRIAWIAEATIRPGEDWLLWRYCIDAQQALEDQLLCSSVYRKTSTSGRACALPLRCSFALCLLTLSR